MGCGAVLHNGVYITDLARLFVYLRWALVGAWEVRPLSCSLVSAACSGRRTYWGTLAHIKASAALVPHIMRGEAKRDMGMAYCSRSYRTGQERDSLCTVARALKSFLDCHQVDWITFEIGWITLEMGWITL